MAKSAVSETSTISNRWSRHPEFYTYTVTFLVEDHLFRVPRGELGAESTVFRDRFLLPRGNSETVDDQSDSETVGDESDSKNVEDESDPETVEGKSIPETVEGESDLRPVILEGVSKKEFESFLRVLIGRQYATKKASDLGQAQWISVLKLSTMWEFKRLREVAIQHLDLPSKSLGSIEKFVLASKYGIKKWLLPALLELAERARPIGVEEGRLIGFENALKLAAVREQLKVTNTIDKTMDWVRENYTLKPRDEGSKSRDFERPKTPKHEKCKSRDGKSMQSPTDKDQENRSRILLITKAFDL
ncbi:hypothetical protein PISMIDRAFT_682944 [Pisolithus microcarpus 441]|uniref:BTB domain-containing protein n=1 Tax=Pisolithus microcarpus 441 TaxID=765257 RepID=A0A0C9Z042_9AGAM|nr:hypothetical protein PISMIDRAFT_682944 [Pisolithus microcarpus 441]